MAKYWAEEGNYITHVLRGSLAVLLLRTDWSGPSREAGNG